MNRQELKELLKRRNPTNPEFLNTIINSASTLNTVMLSYIDKEGVITEREVEPYEMKDGKLWAYCMVKQSIRQFDFGNIVNAVGTTRNFNPRWPVKIP